MLVLLSSNKLFSQPSYVLLIQTLSLRHSKQFYVADKVVVAFQLMTRRMPVHMVVHHLATDITRQWLVMTGYQNCP